MGERRGGRKEIHHRRVVTASQPAAGGTLAFAKESRLLCPSAEFALAGSMTAIAVQAQKLLAQKRPAKSFFESCIRSLIILCAAFAVVLSSISICDGHWLLVKDQLFGLWHFCAFTNNSELNCFTDLHLAQVDGVAVGMVLARSMGALAVVVAIFGLELLMVSQVCEDAHSRRKWAMGSILILISFAFSSMGLFSFVILFKDQVTFTGFTLMFWCEFTSSFLFFLNGISGLHINSITYQWNEPKNF